MSAAVQRTIHETVTPSPIGPLRVACDAQGRLLAIDFDAPAPAGAATRAPAPELAAIVAELAEYFAGRRRRFTLALDPRGTPFQRAVWEALLTVPWGETVSYAEVARRVGRPTAVRAVAAANGANPIPVVIPCHRVIGSDGSLTGYGGGLERKRALLALEGVPVETPLLVAPRRAAAPARRGPARRAR